ncbi:MAG TPA: TIGR03435 family protein [Bryobacteraceae bacterium]|nr:TIGR03435 family protein [Bryobacteraceae bacterium]
MNKSIAVLMALGSPLAYVIATAEPQNAKPGPAFDSVAIHAAAPNTMPQMRSRFGNGRYELHNATAVDLIRTAWSVEADGISGGPDWLDLNRYDVIATAPATATPEMLRTMLQGMLKDRFQLSVRNGSRNNPAWAITVEKKPNLRPPQGTEASGCKFQPVPAVPRGVPLPQMTLECSNVTIPAFAKMLSGASEASGYLFDYPLLDRTGLAGAWSFSLTWSPRRAYNWSPAPGDVVTLASAFEKQLGLKLALTRVAAPVLVVEKATPPRVTDAPKPHMEFEVAEIRPEDPNGAPMPCGVVSIQPGGRVRINMTLRNLIWEAWGAPFDFSRFIGGPQGMDSPCWQILAKVPVEQNVLGTANPAGWNGAIWNGVDLDTMRMSLRSFLVDRFKLAAHLEDRPIDGYVLTAAGRKLRKANPANRPGCKEGPGDDGKDPRLTNPLVTRLITCRNMTLAQFAEQLNGFFPGSPPRTADTGSSERYDMTINFSPSGLVEAAPSEPGVAPEPTGAISLLDALKGQLGLKVETRKVMAPVLIVDHVNATPTEN